MKCQEEPCLKTTFLIPTCCSVLFLSILKKKKKKQKNDSENRYSSFSLFFTIDYYTITILYYVCNIYHREVRLNFMG